MVKLPLLREHRERQALTMRELSAASRVAVSTLVAAEAGGDVFPSTTKKLAAALGVRPRELMEPQEEASAGERRPIVWDAEMRKWRDDNYNPPLYRTPLGWFWSMKDEPPPQFRPLTQDPSDNQQVNE